MKAFIWKLRYAFHIRKLLALPPWDCWQSAVSQLENLNGDISECPKSAAEEERDDWASNV